jgi:hypothetical protein
VKSETDTSANFDNSSYTNCFICSNKFSSDILGVALYTSLLFVSWGDLSDFDSSFEEKVPFIGDFYASANASSSFS